MFVYDDDECPGKTCNSSYYVSLETSHERSALLDVSLTTVDDESTHKRIICRPSLFVDMHLDYSYTARFFCGYVIHGVPCTYLCIYAVPARREAPRVGKRSFIRVVDFRRHSVHIPDTNSADAAPDAVSSVDECLGSRTVNGVGRWNPSPSGRNEATGEANLVVPPGFCGVHIARDGLDQFTRVKIPTAAFTEPVHLVVIEITVTVVRKRVVAHSCAL